MGFEKGHKKVGGRRKGIRNKNSIPLIEKAQELGCDPFEVLIYFAKGDWKALNYKDEIIVKEGKDYTQWEYTIAPAVRMKAAAEASQYLYPKLKAMDFKISSDPNEPVEVNIQWADEDANIQSKDASQDAATETNQSE